MKSEKEILNTLKECIEGQEKSPEDVMQGWIEALTFVLETGIYECKKKCKCCNTILNETELKTGEGTICFNCLKGNCDICGHEKTDKGGANELGSIRRVGTTHEEFQNDKGGYE